MSDEGSNEQSGAFLLPPIELDQLEVDPLVVALLNSAAYLDLSEDDSVEPDDAAAVLETMAGYVRLLDDERLDAMQEQLDEIADWGESKSWEPAAVEFVRDFLVNCGAVEDDDED
jgi:hypothetical protein